VKLDWDAGHGPVTGPINCAIAALTVGWAGQPPTCRRRGPRSPPARAGSARTSPASAPASPVPPSAMRAAGWLGAGGWCSWVIAEGPWSPWGMGTLVAGALGLGGAMVGAHHVEEKAGEKKAQAEEAARKASLEGKRAALAKEWEQHLAEVCPGLLVQIVGVEHWESGPATPSTGNAPAAPSGGTSFPTRTALPQSPNSTRAAV
jgi:hypothetical protein